MADDVEPMATINVNATIRGLMDVARVALQPHMAELSKAETIAALEALLTIIDNAMPDDLQQQDPRVIWARKLLGVLRD